MAYSDYGGYAYRNGERVEERSDFTITPGGGFGTPGSYPGFAQLAAGVPHAEVMAGIMRPVGHAVMGDGPIMVTLYKQSYVEVYRVGPDSVEKVPNDQWGADDRWMSTEWSDTPYLSYDKLREANEPLTVTIDGHKLTLRFTEEDNHYCYAELVQPDGTTWHAWSGYGVGAGLEDDDQGYSTPGRERRVWELFVRPTPPAAAA